MSEFKEYVCERTETRKIGLRTRARSAEEAEKLFNRMEALIDYKEVVEFNHGPVKEVQPGHDR